MTKTRIVGGKIIETTGGNYNIYTKESIIYSAASTITETGVENGVSYGNPESYTYDPVPSEIAVKILNDHFLPLGIPDKNGVLENNSIKFEIQCKKGKAENLTFYIKHNGTTVTTKTIDTALNAGEKATIEWDGFSDSKIYDSTLFTNGELTVEVTGATNEAKDTFNSRYNEVQWVDIKIDDNTKKIDVTLRINLKEATIETSVTKTYADLVTMAIEGLRLYWGRNQSRQFGNSVTINTITYEVVVTALDVDENSMPTLNVYGSTTDFGRSRNWWASRKLFYNEGEAYSIYQEVALKYPGRVSPITTAQGVIMDDENFVHTAAHEIGHEILQAFGGKNDYSYIHKNTSTLLTQEVKQTSTLPLSGEIDLMKYYSDDYYIYRANTNFYNRNVAAERDVLGLLWCSKIKIR